MVFERLRNAINAALEAATPPPDLRDLAGQMRQAVVEQRAAVAHMREDYVATERALAAERQAHDDATRRGRLAGEIQDHETVRVAERFRDKHAQRVAILEQKLAAQRAELGLAERELADMRGQLERLERERPAAAGEGSAARAWRDIESAGGARPGVDLDDELVRGRLDRAAREAAAEEQLRELKRKMGK